MAYFFLLVTKLFINFFAWYLLSMYVCTYVCMHVCMYVCMYVCTYACMHMHIYMFYFIKALQHKCWRSVGHQVLQPAKNVEFRTVCLKSCNCRQAKNPRCTKTASSLQPSDLCSNAYRSLPGDQDIYIYLYLFMCVCSSKEEQLSCSWLNQ